MKKTLIVLASLLPLSILARHAHQMGNDSAISLSQLAHTQISCTQNLYIHNLPAPKLIADAGNSSLLQEATRYADAEIYGKQAWAQKKETKSAQADTSLEKKVQQLFEYSNTQNWEAIRNSLADTLKVFSLNGTPIINNPDTLIAFYKANYKKFPKEHSTIEQIITIGNKAIVKEKITGHEMNTPIYDVLIFEFNENKFTRAWIIFE